jgi:peptide-methionine (R)-S-oxide reductase
MIVGPEAGETHMATSASGYDLSPLSEEEVTRRTAGLSDEERRVLLHQGTEPPFCGGLLANKKPGTYVCRLCELPLFKSASKFESGTGWPSFYEPFDPEHIANIRDASHGMVRVEIRCGRCGGHLGHVFDDGPAPTGLRYCLNSASLAFTEGA